MLYIAANLLLALTYARVGALLAPRVGRVGGTFLALLLPFLDLGIAQSPMLHPEPTALSQLLPGRQRRRRKDVDAAGGSAAAGRPGLA